jgi:hypothetical protein
MKTATNLLSTEYSSTASIVIPTKMSIIKQFSSRVVNEANAEIASQDPCPVITEVKMVISNYLENRYG